MIFTTKVKLGSRTIAPRINATRTIAPQDDWIITLQIIARQKIAPGLLVQMILPSKILYVFHKKCSSFLANLRKHHVPDKNISFTHFFDWQLYLTIWPTISSPLMLEQNSYISTKMLRNVFAYLESINSVVYTRGSDQSRCIITLENLNVSLKLSLLARMWNCLYHTVMNR